MKLSEAIRLGAMLGPQCYGPYIEERTVSTVKLMGWTVYSRVECATCAIGGALMAIGRTDLMDTPTEDVQPEREFPILNAVVTAALNGRNVSVSVYRGIVTANDDLHWSRERIADWVAGIEARADVAQELVAAQELVVA